MPVQRCVMLLALPVGRIVDRNFDHQKLIPGIVFFRIQSTVRVALSTPHVIVL